MVELPSGTVAFLFTDIESSTQLWATHPDEMTGELARHDEMARSCFDSNAGYVFATGGDGFAVAFARADLAVAAAVGLQEKLAELELIRARMGVHVGTADERDGDYFGPVVSLAARVMAAGHGGQILSTSMVASSMPGEWQSLGGRLLSGFEAPVEVHQLGFETFNPLRAPEPDSTNIRPPLTSLLGRDTDVAKVLGLLDDHRLVTVVGVGGVGKTRVAVEGATQLASSFDDGGWIVELAEIETPELLSTAIASALRVPGRPGLSLTESVIATLASREQLVVLDNCEHMLDSVADLVETLLAAAPAVRVIATSREPLDVDGEHVVRLRSLATSDGAKSDAGALFVSRAEAAGATIADADADAIGEIVALLDGIPLAIELAAARARSLSLSDLSERLDQRFRLLRGGRRSAIERHQTLQATVDWSYDLLSDDEAAVFDQLSVFAGGASLRAVEAVAGPELDDLWDLPELLDGLVRKSMIQVSTVATRSRYGQLETMRQYGLQRLAGRGSEVVAGAQQRHAAFYRDWLLEMNERLDYPDMEIHEEVRPDLPNIRVALDQFAAVDDIEDAGRMIDASFLPILSLGTTIREFAERARRVAELLPTDSALRGEALGIAGYGFASLGAFDEAIELAQESIAVAEGAGNLGSALTYQSWATALFNTGQHDEAVEVAQDGLRAVEGQPPTWESTVLKVVLAGWGDQPLDGPDDLSNTAVREAEASGSDLSLAFALVGRSGRQPTEDLAVADLERARSLGGSQPEARLWTALGLAGASHRAADPTRAAEWYAAAAKEAIELVHHYARAIVFSNLALLAAEQGVHQGAAALFDAGRLAERETGGFVRSNWTDDLETIERQLTDLGVEVAVSGPPADDRQLRELVAQVTAEIEQGAAGR